MRVFIIYSTGKFCGEFLNDLVQWLANFHIILRMKSHIVLETQATTTDSGVLIFEISCIFPTWIPLVSVSRTIGLWWNDYVYPMDFLCVFISQEIIFWYVI